MIHGRITRTLTAIAVLGCSWVANAAVIEAVPGEYIVKVKNGATMMMPQAAKSLSAELIRPVSKRQNLFLVRKNILERQEMAIANLSSDSNVVYVEPNYIYRINRLPNDPMLDELWGLRNDARKGGREGIDIGAEKAWDIETGSEDVVVAVIDTGVDYTHPDLAENIWTNKAEAEGKPGVDDDGNGYIDDIHGYDFANNDGDPKDDHSHGTHVSGTIGARGDDGKGIVGVAWKVKIMAVKFLTGEGYGTLEDAIKAVNYATDMGAVIESNSWGGGGFSQALLEAIQHAKEKNVLFVAAAGNESNNNDQNPAFPATYDEPNVLSVAALDNNGAIAYFSNYGAKKVHVAAPGVNVFSSVTNGGYDTYSGTSMATPHVSGIAALIKAHFPERTFAEIKQNIMDGSIRLGSLRNKVVSGFANAYYALSGEAPPVDMEDPYYWEKAVVSAESTHPYGMNARVEYTVKVEGAQKIAVYFDKFMTESNYDFVEFFDAAGNSYGKMSGNHSGEFSPAVPGDTMKLVLTSDESVDDFGFSITAAAYK